MSHLPLAGTVAASAQHCRTAWCHEVYMCIKQGELSGAESARTGGKRMGLCLCCQLQSAGEHVGIQCTTHCGRQCFITACRFVPCMQGVATPSCHDGMACRVRCSVGTKQGSLRYSMLGSAEAQHAGVVCAIHGSVCCVLLWSCQPSTPSQCYTDWTHIKLAGVQDVMMTRSCMCCLLPTRPDTTRSGIKMVLFDPWNA